MSTWEMSKELCKIENEGYYYIFSINKLLYFTNEEKIKQFKNSFMTMNDTHTLYLD